MICIVCPIGNEEKDIKDFLIRIKSLEKFHFVGVFDSFSRDNSKLIFKSFSETDSRFEILDIGKSKGLANAYLEGLKHAVKLSYDKIVEMDVGHPVELVKDIELKLNDNDVVFASRFISGGKFLKNVPFKRRLLSTLGTLSSKLILGMPFSDCTSGLQGFSLDTLKQVPLSSFFSKGHIYQTEMKFYCKNLKYAEIPIEYSFGESSLRWTEIIEACTVLFKLFFFGNACLKWNMSGGCKPDDLSPLLWKIKVLKKYSNFIGSPADIHFKNFLDELYLYVEKTESNNSSGRDVS